MFIKVSTLLQVPFDILGGLPPSFPPLPAAVPGPGIGRTPPPPVRPPPPPGGGAPGTPPESPPPLGTYGGTAGPFPYLLNGGKWLPVVAILAKVSAAFVCDIAELKMLLVVVLNSMLSGFELDGPSLDGLVLYHQCPQVIHCCV